MISVEEALSRILPAVQPVGAPRPTPLSDALARYAAAPALAAIDLPPFDNSAMDGYAVCARDLDGACESSPKRLRCVSAIPAGDNRNTTLSPGACVRIFTGSPLPSGADAVVMQEDVAVSGDEVLFREPVKPLENVRLRGEDLHAGHPVLEQGQKLTPTRIGLLAATGIDRIPTFTPPRVALLGTGNELCEPGQPLQPGQIFESNRSVLRSFLQELGIPAEMRPGVRDVLQETTAALRHAFSTADAVISTGGVSVGDYDFVKDAFRALGGTVDLWQIAMRPGKPFVFGRWNGKVLFGLPGNPVSAIVTFLVLVRPALMKMLGAAEVELPRLPGTLLDAVSNPTDRRHYLRVRWEKGNVRVAGPQKSHMIGALGSANALLDVAPGASLPAGASVPAMLWSLPES